MDTSPFAKLSGELRNRIYELALLETSSDDDSSETVDLEQGWFDCPFHRAKVMNPARTGYVHPLEPLRMTGLPFTCKAIRRESLRLYYSLNKFTFETEYLKSRHKDRIVERLVEWTKRIGSAQAREIRDVTISLSSLKAAGREGEYIDWTHMRLIRSLFHPAARVRVRFYLEGNGSVSFVLGRREDVERELERLVGGWRANWRRVRGYGEEEARWVGERYRGVVERLFGGMPEVV